MSTPAKASNKKMANSNLSVILSNLICLKPAIDSGDTELVSDFHILNQLI